MTMKTRQINRIYGAPAAHWVGDGFHVHSMFSHMAGDKHTDPFLLLDYAAPMEFEPNTQRPHRGVGEHPHKGFETVTIAYRGEVAHRDSSGGGGVIQEGDVQWMTAGNGVVHEEFHADSFTQTGGMFEMVQLWVNLPAKDKRTPPRYQHIAAKDIPVEPLYDANGDKSGHARIIAGELADVSGAAKTFTEMNMWDVHIDSQKSAVINLPDAHNVLLLVRSGRVAVNGDNERVGSAQLITFEQTQGDGHSTITLQADSEPAEVLLLSGVPINEPVVGYGPFVMNTQEEISEAIDDFRQGKFGHLANN